MADKDGGPQAGLKGIAEGFKGKIKEATGALTDRDDLRKADARRDVAVKEAKAEKARATAAAHEAQLRSHQRKTDAS